MDFRGVGLHRTFVKRLANPVIKTNNINLSSFWNQLFTVFITWSWCSRVLSNDMDGCLWRTLSLEALCFIIQPCIDLCVSSMCLSVRLSSCVYKWLCTCFIWPLYLLDVKDVGYVIVCLFISSSVFPLTATPPQNYDFPNNCEDYIHRIGRTGVSQMLLQVPMAAANIYLY